MDYSKEKTAAEHAEEIPHDALKHTITSPSWTPEAEARVVRKMDMLVMPLLWVAMITLQLDRGNIGNALTDNFMADVKIDQNTVNVGQQLLQAGIVIFEIPSNMILYRIGPTVWIPCQIFAWGMVATFQGFVNNQSSFLATRFLLGACEAGFMPAAFYTMTLWYKPSELSKRFGIFYSGNQFALALGGIIAYGILQMRGVAGLAGWQWLFFIEGIITIIVMVVFAVLFPGSPQCATSLFKIKFFNDEEIRIMNARLEQENPDPHGEKKSITIKDLLRTFSDYKLWLHFFMALFTLHAGVVYALYGPTIVRSFGFEALRSNALASVGQWLALVLVITGGIIADWWGRRGYLVIIYLLGTFATTLAFKLLPIDATRDTKFAVLTLGVGMAIWSHPLNGSWMALNAKSKQDRAIRMAMLVMGGNAAGIIAPQLLRADDAPHYPRGWTILTVLMTCALLCAISLVGIYKFLNHQARKRDPARTAGDGFGAQEEVDADGFRVGRVKYYNY